MGTSAKDKNIEYPVDTYNGSMIGPRIESRKLDAERDFLYGNERYNRVEERGQIKKGCCLSFFVVFEHIPVWLSVFYQYLHAKYTLISVNLFLS